MSDEFRIGVDDSQLKEWLASAGDRFRFPASVGLNRTADEIQRAQQESLHNRFTLRRPEFVKRTIYRKPGEDFATKGNLVARVRIHDDRDVLAKFEAGGEKRPRDGKALAIPINVKRNQRDIVPKGQTVRALLAAKKAFVKGGRVWQMVGRGRHKTLRVLYLFKPMVRIPASLGFFVTALQVADRRLIDNVSGAIAKELAGTLTTGKPR